jgi:para-nitrobenzyl esterase
LLLPLLMTLACSAGTQTSPQAGLGGTSWQLVKFQGGDGKTLTPDDKAKYTITFGTDNRVSARVDCNRGAGTWKSSGANQLEFGPLALTRAMCPPGSRSHRQGLAVGAFLHHQGWPSLSIADGGRWNL